MSGCDIEVSVRPTLIERAASESFTVYLLADRLDRHREQVHEIGQQIEVAGLVAKKSLSVRDTEGLVRRIINPHPATREAPAADPDISRLERELADKLGAKVAFQHTASGKGKLVVSYNSLDELEGILGHIQ